MLVLIFVIASLYFYFYCSDVQANARLFAEVEKNATNRLVFSVSRTLQKHYQEHLKAFVFNNRSIAQLLDDRNYNGLLQNSKPFFRQIVYKPSFRSQLIFFHPDKTDFLSLQKNASEISNKSYLSLLSGDNNSLKERKKGFIFNEDGIFYKIVEPLHLQEQWIGSVVLIIGINHFLEEFRQYSNLNIDLLFRENIFTNSHIVPVDLVGIGNDYVLPSENSIFSRGVRQPETINYDSVFMQNGSPVRIFIADSLNDSMGREFCRIIYSRKISNVLGYKNQGLLRASMFASILFVATVLIYLFQKKELNHEHLRFKSLVNQKLEELTESNELLQKEIESRKNVQKSLSYAVEEWHNTFDIINSPIIILDNDHRVVKGNKAAMRLFGNETQLLGKQCFSLLGFNVSSCNDCKKLNKLDRFGGKEFEVEHKRLKKILRVACMPIIYLDEVVGHVLTTMDITLQRELETQLIQAQKMEAIATLAGGIAHDFNNILGAILGNADIVLYQLPDESGRTEITQNKKTITFDDIAEHLRSIKKAGGRAKDLVRQILAFSRHTESMLQAIDITPIIKEVVKLLRASLPATIDIHSNIAPNICCVNADPTQIHQVLMNISTNAAQAMEGHGGVLDISLVEKEIRSDDKNRYHGLQKGKYLVLSVQDTGHGMSKEVQAQIFDPFFTTRDVGKGTGMGLSVIHGIVTAHNGIIDVQSEVGKGSSFSVFLPAITKVETGMNEAVVSMPGGAETVLFVDDEVEIVKMRTKMLEFLGYNVITASSGELALELIRLHDKQVDIVITDLTMPKMTGIQLAEEIMKLDMDLPVILCSGYSETVVPEIADKAGIKKFMAKPLEMRSLANAIREVITNQD